MFLEIDSSENGTEIFSLNRSTANSIFLSAISNTYRTYIWSDGATYNENILIANTDRIKIAIAYKSNDFAIYANGSQVSTNNTLTWTPNITIDALNFNVGGYTTNKGVARYKQVMLIPERISNTSSTETPAASKVDIVLQKITMNARLNILPSKGRARAILQNR